jgi:tetratricopeptide (TPR) repeat protein
MEDYGVRDVERLLGLSRGTIRALVDAGFVSPSRGPRNSLRFSFQDLIVLRTAQALADANVPKRRITRSVRELRRQLPDAMPLSGLSITAVGDQVAVREGSHRWQADSGQYFLEFEANWGRTPITLNGVRPQLSETSADCFELGVSLEASDSEAALRAYERAVELHPANHDARVNLGRLLHELRRFALAETVYREALRAAPDDALLHFNFAVLLEDLNKGADALRSYEAALRLDPGLADAHYNVALLYEKLGRAREVIRHMAQYRRLQSR